MKRKPSAAGSPPRGEERVTEPGASADTPPAVIGWRRWLTLALWLGIASTGWYAIETRYGDVSSLMRAVVDFLSASPAGWALYVGLYSVRLSVWLSATLITLAGGFLYGPVLGTVLTVIAANLSAVVAFLIGRWLGSDVLAHLGDGRLLERWTERLRRAPFEAVLIMRLVYLPFDVVSYASGILRLPLRSFVAATVIGTLPGILQFTLLGASLQAFRIEEPQVRWPYVVLAVMLMAAGLAIARFLRRRGEIPSSAEETTD